MYSFWYCEKDLRKILYAYTDKAKEDPMASVAHKLVATMSPVQTLAARLQTIIRSQSAQGDRYAVIYKKPDEDQQHWDQIIAAIDDTEGVHVNIQSDGAARISWYLPETLRRPECGRRSSKTDH
ncbi:MULTISPECIES: DUF1654 domain-containing protein [Pseudomonas syringae group]|uniref:DUF1654 domain-containing protein n=2 Tax=Pseudomonas syringae group TaxID=136849 RepID=A0AAW4DZE7_PSESX|nr:MULTISPECIES: DUF1654 domain-containing protein [Pseudomonas syringae group]KGK92334.1 hypothetical protein NB04_27145 [Pseudomonas syringae pv. tomato]MBI6701061.1 DUF1654 domain-containing protein [Pseudomonas syringae]MBI6714485.1 DUF1654 domain-containing protein [Pseudomonas syringae]MBI6734982.1 DUF1654 domain-containing protein [Pseudomonas syringae]MBI6859841.1 DUF1654 domain-containing protein [Pseudomonas syringae]